MTKPARASSVLEADLAQDDASPLEAIRLLLPDIDLAGWIRPRGERVTDLLQPGLRLAFLPAGADATEWMLIEPADLLAVVPPPHTSPPERRVPRQLHEVYITSARYVITGVAHLLPGEEFDPYLRSTRPFLPLTSARLANQDGRDPEHVGVIIVNLSRVTAFEVH